MVDVGRRGADLIALAERVERATGADREIDGAIDRLFNVRPRHGDYDSDERALWQVRNGWSGLLVRSDGFARGSFSAADYTGSLDAAMSLKPAGWDWSAGTNGEENSGPWACLTGPTEPYIDAAASALTPALALTAASLRALAALEAVHD